VDSVLDKCDGNMLATALMATALGERAPDWWEKATSSFMQTASPIVSAIHTALDSLAASADKDKRAAVAAFAMLRHLQCRLPLPVPLLQLLWSTLHPPPDDDDVNVLLGHLKRASLLCYQQVRGRGRECGEQTGVGKTICTAASRAPSITLCCV